MGYEPVAHYVGLIIICFGAIQDGDAVLSEEMGSAGSGTVIVFVGSTKVP